MSDSINELNQVLAMEGVDGIDVCPEATAFHEYNGADVKEYENLRKKHLIAFYKYVAMREPHLLFERGTEKTYWRYNYETGVYDDLTNVDAVEIITKLLIDEGFRVEGKVTMARQVLLNYRAMFPQRGVSFSDFDNYDDYFHAKNGWVNLETGEFSGHTPLRLSRRVSAVSFDPDATCPLYDKMLDSDFQLKKDQIRVIDQFSGLLLTGDISHQKMLTLIGKPGCGKSTLIDVWKSVLGDMATSNSLTDLTGDRFRFIGASLAGRTLCHFDEVDVKRSEMGSNLGNLITGTTFRLERKGENNVTNARNRLKCVLTANSMPQSAEIGIFRRIIFIEFVRSFYDEETVDRQLPKKLQGEISGILNRMIRGLADMRKMGGFTMIEGHDDLIEGYKVSSNTVAEFLNEYFEPGTEEDSVSSTVLFNTYKEFMGDNRFKMTLTPQRFGQLLGSQPLRAFTNMRSTKGAKGIRYWTGIRIRDEYTLDQFDAQILVPKK